MNTTNKKWWVLISVGMSAAITGVDFAIVNTALPAIQMSLHASILQLQWMMNIFVLLICMSLVMAGRLADIFGRRLVNYIGVILFGIASLLCGLATDPNWLIVFRGLQGLASAIIIPCSLAIITNAFPPAEQGKAVGIWSSIIGIGLAIGPVLGGIIVGIANWRWIFFINIPFTIISLALAIMNIKESHAKEFGTKIDWSGFILLSVGIGALIIGIIQGQDWGWNSVYIIGLFIIGILALIVFYYVERNKASPLLQVKLFANKTFFAAMIANFALVFFAWAAFFLMPLYLHTVHGQSTFVIGFMLLPITVIFTIIAPIAGHWVDKSGPKIPILCGILLLAMTACLQALFHIHTSTLVILFAFIVFGFAWGLIFGPSTHAAIAALPANAAGIASGALWTLQNMGGALGLALAGTLFRAQSSFISGYHAAMWLLCAIAVVAAIIFMVLLKQPRAAKNA